MTRRLTLLLVIATIASCKSERREFRAIPPGGSPDESVPVSQLGAGGRTPAGSTSTIYAQNAYALRMGQTLFHQMNCVGCHFHGGGGIGPALMDDKWIYGSSPINIFSSIVEGRPNGMPSWRNKITDAQVWQLVAYVQSMSGQAPQTAMPNRSDHMQSAPPENNRSAQTPVETGKP